jgi:pilus assembly protein CpaB
MKLARVVVLVVALGAGGVAAMLASRGGKETIVQVPSAAAPQIELVEVMVARNDIPVGKALGPQDVGWQSWPAASASPDFIRASARPGAINEINGSIVRTPFANGEPIRESKLIKAGGAGYLAAVLPAGMRASSFEITPESGVAGFILPNDRVDILLTRAEKAFGQDIYKSEVILPNVRVLAIDQTVEEKNGQKNVIGKIATVELTPTQTETLSVARRLGSLSLVLRSLAEKNDTTLPPGSPLAGNYETINVIRFGSGIQVLK